MSWLRVDDRFASHPKIAQLSDREFRIWVRTLCFCGTYQDPTVDKVALAEVPGLTKKNVARFSDLGLLDKVGDSFEVHDWAVFQPKDLTGADRQAKWRARNGSRNDSAVTDSLASRARSPVPSPTRPKEQDLTPTVRAEKTPSKMKVDGKIASQGEWAESEAILDAFNDVFGTRFAAKEWLAKIVMRCREHPDLTVGEHRAVIERTFAAPWWSDSPSPAVVYGNAGLFEKALSAVGTPVNGSRPNMKYGQRDVSAAEFLALGERLKAERLESERSEISAPLSKEVAT